MSSTESTYLGDWLAWEQDNRYSRKDVTIVDGSTLVTGQAVGIVTASSKYAPFDQDLSDGTETCVGISVGDYAPDGADVTGTIICRDAIVVEDNLTFPSDITAGEQATAMAALAALGIITKEGS